MIPLGSEAGAQDKKPKEKGTALKPLSIPLTKIPAKKGTFRMGWNLEQVPPAEAWQAKFPKAPATGSKLEVLLLFDLNGSGTLETGSDGLALPGYPFIVPLPERLLLRTGQYQVSFEGMKALILNPEALGVNQKYCEDASILTELRIRAGLIPVPMDANLTLACEKHTEYLKLNGISDGSAGMSVHLEEPGKPGYTPEGADAGKMSNIGCQVESLALLLRGCFATPWHGSPMLDPNLKSFGGAAKNQVTMLYLGSREGFRTKIYLHPPDGATGVPRAFGSRGEAPNPVPGTRYAVGCGFPILIQLIPPYSDLVSAELLDPKGVRVPGTHSSPARPANPEWPTNSNCAVFIPSKPLEPETTYRVTFKFAEPEEPVRWSFTTEK